MIQLRRATLEDAAFLLRLRNDPASRANSLNTDPVALQAHTAWLRRALGDPSVEIYVAMQNGEPVGMVRVQGEGGPRELSWIVAPERRGEGLGGEMLRAAVEHVPGPLRAKIKTSNQASRKLAEGAGFRLEGEADGFGEYVRGG